MLCFTLMLFTIVRNMAPTAVVGKETVLTQNIARDYLELTRGIDIMMERYISMRPPRASPS